MLTAVGVGCAAGSHLYPRVLQLAASAYEGWQAESPPPPHAPLCGRPPARRGGGSGAPALVGASPCKAFPLALAQDPLPRPPTSHPPPPGALPVAATGVYLRPGAQAGRCAALTRCPSLRRRRVFNFLYFLVGSACSRVATCFHARRERVVIGKRAAAGLALRQRASDAG